MSQAAIDPETWGLPYADRLIAITQACGSNDYINAAGESELYQRPFFFAHGVELHFLRGHFEAYRQYHNDFISGLSIIDVLMFNPHDQIRTMLGEYTLD